MYFSIFLRFSVILGILLFTSTQTLLSFCGFYAAKADASLYNNASRVVFARIGERTVITMENDYEGEPNEFAMIIPVPTVIQREDIRVVQRSSIDALDDYSAPRLAEYFDPSPCPQILREFYSSDAVTDMATTESNVPMDHHDSENLGVEIEAQFEVEEYEILILSARDSDGLQMWLKRNQYNVPEGAGDVLQAYIKRDMRFFVAKVNLEKHSRSGATNLRPLQVAFQTDKFMLPIRLGTVNAKGAQDLIVILLTKNGRVESSNYRTVQIPTNQEIPSWTKAEFGEFYTAMFERQLELNGSRAVHTEYSWSLTNKCDPCVAEQPAAHILADVGAVHWYYGKQTVPQSLHITRLHVRYTSNSFPEDLMFHETRDRQNFQGRYVIRHVWNGTADCDEFKEYRQLVEKRQEREAQNLAVLTGWDIDDIRTRTRVTMGDFYERDDQKESQESGIWNTIKAWFDEGE